MPFSCLSDHLSPSLPVHLPITAYLHGRLSGDNPLADAIIVESEVEEDEARRFLEDIRANYPEVCMPSSVRLRSILICSRVAAFKSLPGSQTGNARIDQANIG